MKKGMVRCHAEVVNNGQGGRRRRHPGSRKTREMISICGELAITNALTPHSQDGKRERNGRIALATGHLLTRLKSLTRYNAEHQMLICTTTCGKNTYLKLGARQGGEKRGKLLMRGEPFSSFGSWGFQNKFGRKKAP